MSIRYHSVAIGLHWSIALLIGINLLLGLNLESDWVEAMSLQNRIATYQWHKTLGIMVLVLSVFRLIWRLTHQPPALPTTMPHWEQMLAHVAHWLLYALMIGLPLSGWVLVSASTLGIPTLMFNWFAWPHLPIQPLLNDPAEFAKNTAEIHEFLADVLMACLLLHVAAALRHHFWLRDDMLKRMLPSKK